MRATDHRGDCEDVAGGAATEGQRDAYGGVLGVTKGLFAESRGPGHRHADHESAIMGAAAGAAVTGCARSQS